MRAMWFAGLVLVAALTVAASTRAQTPAPAAQTAPAPAGNADTGKTLYVSVGCWQCHGYEGQGGAAGPRLASRPLPFAGKVDHGGFDYR